MLLENEMRLLAECRERKMVLKRSPLTGIPENQGDEHEGYHGSDLFTSGGNLERERGAMKFVLAT